MNRKQLEKIIEDEVSKIISEPIREPQVQRAKPKSNLDQHVLRTEEEIDIALFGKKEPAIKLKHK